MLFPVSKWRPLSKRFFFGGGVRFLYGSSFLQNLMWISASSHSERFKKTCICTDIQFILDTPKPPYMRDLHSLVNLLPLGEQRLWNLLKKASFQLPEPGIYQVQAENVLPWATGSLAASRDGSATYKWNPVESERTSAGAAASLGEHPVPCALALSSLWGIRWHEGSRDACCPRWVSRSISQRGKAFPRCPVQTLHRCLKSGRLQNMEKTAFLTSPSGRLVLIFRTFKNRFK